MRNTYNKGRFRNGEWAKHLRPFLKRVGNKRWRGNAKVQIQSGLLVSEEVSNKTEFVVKRIPRKQKKTVKVKITSKGFGVEVYSYIRKYSSVGDEKFHCKK